jgi:hypothetical protein
MTTATEERNGTAKPGVRAGQAAKPGAGETSASDGAGEGKEGLNLFGSGRLSQDALKEQLQGFLGVKGKPAKEEETAEEPTAGTESTEGEQTEGEGELEQQAETENPEGTEEETEPKPDAEQETEQGEWPKSAIHEISEQRKRRREAESQVAEKDRELSELRAKLEGEDLKRPVAPTAANPLSFADSPEKLEQWENNTRGIISLIEDRGDNALDEEGEGILKNWAKRNGAWDEESETFNESALRKLKRQGEEALRKYAPQRREFFKERDKYDAMVTGDKVLGPLWTDKNSQAYKDMMGVLGTIPEVRNLSQMKVALAMYALGMQTYRKLTGQPGGGQSGKPAAAGGAPKIPAGKKVVNPPGRSVVLPRNNATPDQAKTQELVKRIRAGQGTDADYEQYTKLKLQGKIPAAA